MTIYDLRKIIAVTEWVNDLDGAQIYYVINSIKKNVYLKSWSLLSELKAISSIESDLELENGYNLSQWDALNIVIRHEYGQYMASEIDNSDIGKAINKLKP